MTITIIQNISAFFLVLDIITRLYVTGIKSFRIAKYTIFINDLLILANLTINNTLYFSQKITLFNYLKYLNMIYGLLILFRTVCIIIYMKNTTKKQKNVRVKIMKISFNIFFNVINSKKNNVSLSN